MSKLVVYDTNANSWVTDDSKEINRGGEARILPTTNNKVLKLYFDKSQAISQQKISELSSLDSNLFVKPELAIVRPETGFVMQELDSAEYYPLYSLFSGSFIKKRNLPNDFKNKISDKLIIAVKNAHDNNIVIGDLNPFNIMVNDNLDVKFIDVDSYQTSTCKHNDKLLEDIRDYYYGGKVSKESDYFALSIIIFNLLTGIHPYKGFHNTYGNVLKDRMIHNLSIISNEANNIKIPKFYQPISDKNLLSEFEDIFNKNERFLIDLKGVKIQTVSFDGITISNDLIITTVYSGTIKQVISSKSYICVTTDTSHVIFKSLAKGVVQPFLTLNNDVHIILTDKYIYGYKDGTLKYYNEKSSQFVEIDGLSFKDVYLIKQYENILLVLTKNDLAYKIDLDVLYGNSVQYSTFESYYKSFKKYNSVVQRIGDTNYIFYNNGKDLNQIVYPSIIKDVIQVDNVGIVSKVENNQIVYELFSIDKFGKVKRNVIDANYPFTANKDFIILYKDDGIHFLAKDTLMEVVSFGVTGLDMAEFINSTSGIIAYTDKEVKILNRK